MSWTWNRDYKDLSQVEPFWPSYAEVLAELEEAGQYPYNDSFTGRIPGIEGPDEHRAIYMLQTLRDVRAMEAKVAERREQGWVDVTRADLTSTPKRFAKVAAYGYYMGGTGFQEWEDARLHLYGTSVILLPKRARTRGLTVLGRLLALPA